MLLDSKTDRYEKGKKAFYKKQSKKEDGHDAFREEEVKEK